MIREALASALLVLTACTAQPTDSGTSPASLRREGLGLASGTSFGMCVGYCRTELVFDSPTVRFTELGNTGDVPERTRSATLGPAEWSRLRSALDVAALARLEGVHGCPDCADGGAEWIQIERPATLRVTFEYGSVLAPIAPLQAELRALRAAFPR